MSNPPRLAGNHLNIRVLNHSFWSQLSLFFFYFRQGTFRVYHPQKRKSKVLPLTGRSVLISVRRHAASTHTRIKLTCGDKETRRQGSELRATSGRPSLHNFAFHSQNVQLFSREIISKALAPTLSCPVSLQMANHTEWNLTYCDRAIFYSWRVRWRRPTSLLAHRLC